MRQVIDSMLYLDAEDVSVADDLHLGVNECRRSNFSTKTYHAANNPILARPGGLFFL